MDAQREAETVRIGPVRSRRVRIGAAVVGAIAVFGVVAAFLHNVPDPAGPGELGRDGALTILVFIAAVAGWMSRRSDDTFVALAAAVVLVVCGVMPSEDVFESLGQDQIWLLVAAFVLAAGIERTGLPARSAVALATRARRPRGLFHLITVALVGTALLVPSTSGRAALVLPLYLALAATFASRQRMVRALAVLFPAVVLLSAIASLLGAGAHLITSEILDSTIDAEIGFARWLLWGLPFAAVSSHLAAEIVLLLFTRHCDRSEPLRIDAGTLRRQLDVPERLQRNEVRAAVLLGCVVLLWSTEPVHGLSPALVALVGALVITSPRVGTVGINAALAGIPWSLLLFMAATSGLGTALTESGAAAWVVAELLGRSRPEHVLLGIVVLSVAAHLLVQSRSARSSVLIPVVVPAAAAAGLNPVAVAFASTAAAGFCHTLTSSAKPVAMFAGIEQAPTFAPRDLLKLSALLGPALGALVLLFARYVWPVLGLPLT